MMICILQVHEIYDKVIHKFEPCIRYILIVHSDGVAFMVKNATIKNYGKRIVANKI